MNKEEELCLHFDLLVFRRRFLLNKLAEVAVRVPGPQLGDAHVDGVAPGVPADAEAALVGAVAGAEVDPGVLEDDVTGTQPAALQVEADGRRAAGRDVAGKVHGAALVPLQEPHVTANWTETNVIFSFDKIQTGASGSWQNNFIIK